MILPLDLHHPWVVVRLDEAEATQSSAAKGPLLSAPGAPHGGTNVLSKEVACVVFCNDVM